MLTIAITAAGREFVIQQDIFFLAFGFRFGRIHPPGIGADAEKSFIHQVPIIFARLGTGGVIHGHRVGVVGRLRIFELIDEPTFALHVVVIRGAGFEERPDRNHQVKIFGCATRRSFPWDRDNSC